MSNTGLPKVQVASGGASDEQPEVDISDEEFLQFDTSRFPVIVTLTKVMALIDLCRYYCKRMHTVLCFEANIFLGKIAGW